MASMNATGAGFRKKSLGTGASQSAGESLSEEEKEDAPQQTGLEAFGGMLDLMKSFAQGNFTFTTPAGTPLKNVLSTLQSVTGMGQMMGQAPEAAGQEKSQEKAPADDKWKGLEALMSILKAL